MEAGASSQTASRTITVRCDGKLEAMADDGALSTNSVSEAFELHRLGMTKMSRTKATGRVTTKRVSEPTQSMPN